MTDRDKYECCRCGRSCSCPSESPDSLAYTWRDLVVYGLPKRAARAEVPPGEAICSRCESAKINYY